MGSARDGSPNASQAGGAAHLLVPAHGWLCPLSSHEPPPSSGSRGISARSCDSLPASAPLSSASPLTGLPDLPHFSRTPRCAATPPVEAGSDIRAVAGRPGRQDGNAPRIPTRVLNRGKVEACSPGDALRVLSAGMGRNHSPPAKEREGLGTTRRTTASHRLPAPKPPGEGADAPRTGP